MGRFVSVGSKLAMATIVVLLLVTAAVYVSLSRFEHDRMLTAKEQAARMAGDLFLRSASTPILFDDATGIRDTVALLAQDPEVIGVEIWRARALQKIGERIAAQLKSAGEPGVAPAYVETASIERRADRIVLRDVIRDQDKKTLAVVAVQYSLQSENRAFAKLRRRILLCAAGVGVLLALLLFAVTRRWITAPLGRLLRAVRQLEAGERVELSTAQRNDEVGRLAEAFDRMAEAVDHREREVIRRNNDMKLLMDSVAQGFLSVTREGVLLPEHSAILETWFGPWRAGETFSAYLGAIVPKAGATIALLWENIVEDFLPIELALAQMPHRIETAGKTFSLAFRPILRGEEINILIVVSDVTIEIEQQRTKVEQEELVSMFQWLVNDRAGLLEYFEDAKRQLHTIADGKVDDRTLLAREIHTLKGNSGVFGLTSIVAACQTIEAHFEEGAQALSEQDRDELLGAWQRVDDRRRQLVGDETRQRIELEIEEHRSLLDAIAQGAPRAEIEAQVRSWTLEPARQRLARIGEQARKLARRLGKGDIAVLVEANDIRLPDKALGEFFGTFAHLLRNAVDHGLETPAERQRAGKRPIGSILLRTLIRGEQFIIEIEDDGRGIDWRRLMERARARGLPSETQRDLVEALFVDGVSTRESVTEISGRGVGLSAVRSACDRTGGKVLVESEPGEGARFQFCWPMSMLYQDHP